MATNTDGDTQVAIEDLPITFKVKYIGSEMSRGLWGIKYTRRPVDNMVAAAKNLPANKILPHCELKVSTDAVTIDIISPKNTNGSNSWSYAIDTISYGVQDLVYTRVFAMIIVKDDSHPHPYEVHAFVCDSRAMARRLTYALAAAFQDYSKRVRELGGDENDKITPARQKFSIDIRSPEEIAEGIGEETEA